MTELQLLARILVVCFTVALVFSMGVVSAFTSDEHGGLKILSAGLVIAGLWAPAIVAVCVLLRILHISL